VSRSILPQAILIDIRRGAYVQVGMGAVMTQPVPLFQLIAKEIRVVGSFRYGPGDFKFAVSLAERGVVDLRPLVTQRYSFEKALEAFNTTRAGKDLEGTVRSVLLCHAVLR
jgi:D-xylulose reductase